MLVGKTLRNRYNILQVLGSGGFGDTYLAQDTDLPSHPKCVVKQLKPKDPNPQVLPIAKSLFEREAEYLYKLGNSHPQIPQLFAHFEENGEFYLVEEFIDGYSLEEEVRVGQKLSEPATIVLLIEILEVLAFVHQQNVIHRDIKLANLMRRRSDRKIILIDFGAVKDVGALGTDSQGNTNVTVSIGSPGYMPSEQARGKPRLSSDVYAVGMIGIQSLTGITPDSLKEDAITGEILWRDRAQVSSAFAEILQKMVFYHFSQRYESAIEALQAMQSLSATNIHNIYRANAPSVNIAPTEAIKLSGATAPVPTPTTPQIPDTITIAHPTISAHRQSSINLQLILWIALILLTSVSAAIATVFLLLKLTSHLSGNNNLNNSPKPEITAPPSPTTTATPTQSSSPSPTIEPPKPTATQTDIASSLPILPPNTPNKDNDSYGAIAFSTSTRYKGYAWNFSSQKTAEARALSECKSASSASDCQVLIWARNACMTIAEGSNGSAGSAWAKNSIAAEVKAKEVCQKYQGINCTVTRTICLPVR